VVLSRAVARRARQDRDREFALTHPWIVQNYEVLLNRILDYLEQQGVVPIVVRYASNDQPVQEQRSDPSARIASERGVLVCDVGSRFPALGERKRGLFKDGVHYTPKGSEMIAGALLEVILEAEATRRAAVAG
jgi:lysophospholipase L1-like esterase